ncbi:MAG: hypothetical protein WBM28_12255 [Burkholderiales bacterium]
MKISILDDCHDTLRMLKCFGKLTGHDLGIWNDHVQDDDALAKRLQDAEALVLIRERAQVRVSEAHPPHAPAEAKAPVTPAARKP